MDESDRKASSRLGGNANLLHGFVYFAPEAAEEFRAIGLDGELGYFPGRAAPMGAVSASVVTATFFNFRPDRVEAAIPRAWAIVSPAVVQAARLRAVGRVFDGLAAASVVDASVVAAANDTTERMCHAIGYEGRPLSGANREVELPDDPLVALWQRLTVLREWRGDAHVAVLTATPVDAVEALVLHAGTGIVAEPVLRATRGWSDDEWRSGVERLTARGLTMADGTLTPAGIAFRDEIELRTDEVCLPLVDAVGAETVHGLIDDLRPLRDALLAGGVFPFAGGRTDDQ